VFGVSPGAVSCIQNLNPEVQLVNPEPEVPFHHRSYNNESEPVPTIRHETPTSPTIGQSGPDSRVATVPGNLPEPGGVTLSESANRAPSELNEVPPVLFTEQLNGTDVWRAAARQVLVRRVPDTVTDGALQESFSRFLWGFDAMPRVLLDVRDVRRREDPRTGERIAYVELASVLASQIVTHAAEKAPGTAMSPLKILRDEDGVSHKVFIPTRQKWVFEPAAPTEAEAEALLRIWDGIGFWDPRHCAYARALCEVRDLSALVREKVASYTGEDWDIEVLSVGRHAFVRFPSIAAADEFFDRPRRGEWGAELFVCRHQDYLPAPALFLGVKPPQSYSFFDFSRAQMSNSREARVRETTEPPSAKPQPPKTSSPVKLDSTRGADSADVWVHDLYEAAYVRSPDETDVRKQEDLQGVQSEMPGHEVLSNEGEGIEKRGDGAQSEGRQLEAKLEDLRNGNRPKSATDGISKAPRKEQRKEKLAVGVKKPVDRWANPFAQLIGFEEEIVPPSSISKETVKVKSAGKRGDAEAASEDGVNGGRVGEEETGGEGVGNGKGGKTDWEGKTEERSEGVEMASKSVRVYGKVRGGMDTKGPTEEVPGEKKEMGVLETVATQAEGTGVAEKQVSGNTDLYDQIQTGEEEVKQAMQPGGASEGHVLSGATKVQNDSYGKGSGAVNSGEVDGLPGEELFEDVPEGFEAEPEGTETPEWSRTVSDGTGGFNSSIGLGSISGVFRKPEPEDLQTQAGGEVKTGDQTVETLTSGSGPLTESGIRTRFGQTGSDAPLEFELSMEHVQNAPLRPLQIEQHSEVKATEEGWELLLLRTTDGKVLGGKSKVNEPSEGDPEAVAESGWSARADASKKNGEHVTEEETGGTG
jgi:hypothetical protein